MPSSREEGGLALVIKDMVKRLLAEVGKPKPTPICPYIFHFYHYAKTMKLEDKKAYKIGEAMLKDNIDPDPELEPTEEEESEQESLSLEEIVALEEWNKSPPYRLKHTARGERKVPLEKESQKQAEPSHEVGDSFQNIVGKLKKIWAEFLGLRDLIRVMCTKIEVDDPE